MRLLDRVWMEIMEKNLYESLTYLQLTKNSLNELLKDYEDNLDSEVVDVGRKPSVEDLNDYFNVKIIIDKSEDSEEEYKLFTSI